MMIPESDISEERGMELYPTLFKNNNYKIEEQPLTLQDYRLIKEALIEGKATDTRNVLICQALFGTGLRISELLRVTPAHISEAGPDTILFAYRGKRNKKERWTPLPLNPELAMRLKDYIRGLRIPLDSPVFRIQDRQVRRIVSEASLKALGRSINPHQFRKLYVKVLVDGGLPITAVANMVGHKNHVTTQEWYYDLTLDQRKEINRRIPV